MFKFIFIYLCISSFYIILSIDNNIISKSDHIIVEKIEFIGLKRTKPKFLNKFIKLKIGKFFKESLHQESLQNLKNIRIFYSVDSKLIYKKNTVIVQYICKDKWTLLPIIRGGVIERNFWLQLGIHDFNFLGSIMHFGGFYQYYDRHGGKIFLYAPYLFNRSWGINLLGYYFNTLEPLNVSPSDIVNYNVNKGQVEFFLIYNVSFQQRFELGLAYLDEVYQKVELERPGIQFLHQRKFLFKLWYTFDYIYYDRLLLRGFSYKIRLEPVLNLPNRLDFIKIENEYKHFFQFFKKDTLALRLYLGISSNIGSEYPTFVIDSFTNIRGAGNKIQRGDIEFTFNIEYRYLVYEHEWFSFQVATFFDNAYLFAHGNQHLFYNFFGGGIRVSIPRIHGTLLLFDYAFNVQNHRHHGLLFKVGQFL